MPAKAKPKFEEAMARLREIVEKLESGEEPLESAMALFEEGARLSAQCYETLEKAEQKLSSLPGLREEEDD